MNPAGAGSKKITNPQKVVTPVKTGAESSAFAINLISGYPLSPV